MKKILAALIAVALLVGVCSIFAFAGTSSTLTADQFTQLKAAADFRVNAMTSFSAKEDFAKYLAQKYPQSVYYEYGYETDPETGEITSIAETPGYYAFVIGPTNTIETEFYSYFSLSNAENKDKYLAPKDSFSWLTSRDNYYEAGERILFTAEKQPATVYVGLDEKNNTVCFSFYASEYGKGHPYYIYHDFADNGDGTYSIFYASVELDKVWSNPSFDPANGYPTLENGVELVFKFENDSVVFVKDSYLEKLPAKVQPDTFAPSAEEIAAAQAAAQPVKYDVPAGLVIAGDSAFAAGTTISAKTVESGAVYDAAKKAMNGLTQKFVVFDINALKDGAAVQPNGKVKVTFPIPATLSVDNLKLFYVSADGKRESIKLTVDKKAKTATAELSHFSTYVLANVITSPGTGDTTNYTLWYVLTFVSFAGIALSCVALKTRKED